MAGSADPNFVISCAHELQSAHPSARGILQGHTVFISGVGDLTRLTILLSYDRCRIVSCSAIADTASGISIDNRMTHPALRSELRTCDHGLVTAGEALRMLRLAFDVVHPLSVLRSSGHIPVSHRLFLLVLFVGHVRSARIVRRILTLCLRGVPLGARVRMFWSVGSLALRLRGVSRLIRRFLWLLSV